VTFTPLTPSVDDRPRRQSFDRERVVEQAWSLAATGALTWTVFHLAGWNAAFGFVFCWFASFIVVFGVVVRQRHGSLQLKDRLATAFVAVGTSIALLPLVLILYYVAVKGAREALTNFPHFLVTDMKGVGSLKSSASAGMKHAIIGSVEQVGLAFLFSVPVGILAAAYLNEIGGRAAGVIRTVVSAMTGLPSIIAGIVVYTAWVSPRGVHGASGLAAAMALSIVMLPTIVRTAEEVLTIVPGSLREAALALGAPEWRVVVRVVLPTARAGLVTAALLGVARAVGETAPVLATAFGTPRTNANPFRGDQADLPLQIYQLIFSTQHSSITEAWGAAFLLIAIILTLFTLARILGTGGQRTRRA
jgi:phosphate transport system permease protein